MGIELTLDQARVIARQRARWPEADVRTHPRPWGLIVEVSQLGRTVSLTAFDRSGGVRGTEPVLRFG